MKKQLYNNIYLLFILLLLSTFAVAGCEQSGPGELKESKASTKSVPTLLGDITIPSHPSRIAAFGMPGDLVAIGLNPICGNSEARLFDGLLLEEKYQYAEINDFETIMAQSPDLIIVSYKPEPDIYKKLSAIAPTVTLDSLSLSMPDRIRFLGDILDRKTDAEKAISNFEKASKKAKEKLLEAGINGKTVTIMEGDYLFGDKYGRGANIVYNYLGFSAPPKLSEAFKRGDLYLQISMETLPDYCGDYIIESVWDGSEDLSNNPIWNTIPAVKKNHVIKIDFTDYYSGDLYTSNKQLTHLTDAFLSLAQ